MSSLSLSRADIAPFADLGTAVETEDDGFRLTRNGNVLQVKPDGDGYQVAEPDQVLRKYASAGHVLADSMFANLPLVARNQAILLASQRIMGRPVPIAANLSDVFGEGPQFSYEGTPWAALDDWLCNRQETQSPEATDLLLIDGPAGVGKTTIVRETALQRAESYDGNVPLILQIASRGRVLQNISDLIAFALQDVRSNITVAQLTPLMRHGLITLAIDGFDELSDPNGFETAWSGLNYLLGGARGKAAFLLAGRETFVSTDTMKRQMTAIDSSRGDRLATLSLADPDPEEAQTWLLEQEGWSQSLLDGEFIGPLFSEGSYALRPFFLDVIAKEPKALTSGTPPTSDLLSYLVEVMTQREAGKFVDALDPPDGNAAASIYEAYVARFLEEVARDLAENQSEAIADDALDLIATVAADGILPDDQIAAVVQRARTVVFLANDLQAGHVRFAHEQLLQHFLAREALRSVGGGETPRYIRRNLFGREALDVFAHVARDRTDETEKFLGAVHDSLGRPARDRTHTNLAVLGVAAMCGAALDGPALRVQGIGIGELHFPFAAPAGIVFRGTPISLLHAKGADIREVAFEEGVSIATLEIDRRSLLAETMPVPQTLVSPDGTTGEREAILRILNPSEKGAHVDSGPTLSDEVEELLGRIDRYRSFWLRTAEDAGRGKDKPGLRIITHPKWPEVYSALKELGLVTVRTKDASGKKSDFVHFRQDVRMLEHADLRQRFATQTSTP